MSWVDHVVAWGFFIAMAAPAVFVAVYLTTKWWKTWEGRVIMTQKLLFTGFLINGVLYYWVGEDYPGRDVYRLALFTIMPIAFWGMTILLISARLKARRSQPQMPEPAPESHPPVEDHQ